MRGGAQVGGKNRWFVIPAAAPEELVTLVIPVPWCQWTTSKVTSSSGILEDSVRLAPGC